MLDLDSLGPAGRAVVASLIESGLTTGGPRTISSPDLVFQPDALASGRVTAQLKLFDDWIAVSRQRGYPDIREGLLRTLVDAVSPMVIGFTADRRAKFVVLLRREFGD